MTENLESDKKKLVGQYTSEKRTALVGGKDGGDLYPGGQEKSLEKGGLERKT